MTDTLKKTLLTILSVGLILAGLTMRVKGLGFVSGDMHAFVFGWYDQLAREGFSSFRTGFANYTPPYLYLLWLATWTHSVLPKVVAIKIVPILFDVGNMFWIYKVLKLKYEKGSLPVMGASVFFVLPTVILNSSWWGQADSLYTFFVLASLYFLLTVRPLPAMLLFGMAFSFKFQAAFLVPFLLILSFKKRIPWHYFAVIPVVYIMLSFPAVLAGRPVLDVLMIYSAQASYYVAPSMHAPNLYSLIIYPPYFVDWNTAIYAGFALSAITIPLWIAFYSRKQYAFSPGIMLLTALVSFAFVPFVLPKMHDRYFYPADVLSLAFAFYYPAYWYIPICYQIASGIVYSIFLFSVKPESYLFLFATAAIFTTVALGSLLIIQHRETIRLQEQN